ncbi:MAG TPA: RNA-binding protein [Burkholderiales bacterium]|nr:RNA-binding protein [Burkholderiales bacterium]
MRPEVMEQLREAHDIYSLTRGVLDLCEPYGPVHSFKLVHNRGAARVVCFIELESQRQQPALVRALGAKVINGSACLDIPVGEEFGGAYKVAPLAMRELRRETAAQVTN